MEGPSRPHSPPLLLYVGDLAATAAAVAVALEDGEVGGMLDAQVSPPNLPVITLLHSLLHLLHIMCHCLLCFAFFLGQMQIPSLLVLCRVDHDHDKGKEAGRAGRQGGEPGHGGAPDLASGSPDLAILSPDLPPLPLSVFFCQ